MIVAKKNAAYYLSFPAIDSTSPESYKTGVSPVDTAYYKDGAGVWTALAITDTASEIGTTGVYEIDLTAAELNHDKVVIKFAVSGMADDAYQFDLSTKLTDDLQDITTAQVNTECDTALTDYDAPTNAEMVARTLVAADYFDPAVDAVATVTTLTNKTGFSLSSTGLDAIASTATGMVEIAKAIWDRVLSGATHNISASAGRRLRVLQDSGNYGPGGLMVYLDTVHGTAGAVVDENGTRRNPVDTIADVVTLMTNLPAHQLYVYPDSTFAPAGDFNDANVYGVGYTATLGGHDYAGTHIYHASPMNGIATTVGATDHFDVLDSIIDVMTSDDAHFTNCIFKGTYTFGTSGIVSPSVNMNHCKSGIAGASAPVFAKTASATLTLSVRDWKGGYTLNGLESGDVVTIGGTELGTITLSGSGGAVEIRGIYKELSTGGFSGTVNIAGAIKGSDVASALADTAELQGDWVDGGRLDLILDGVLLDTGTTIPGTITTLSSDVATVDTVVDAVKVKTDQMAFTVANQVDSNAKSMNDEAITGVGTPADPWT